jgi:predicted MFS family arabinose efflux permease
LVPLATRAPVGLVAVLLSLRMFDETAWFFPAGTYAAFRHDLGLSFAQASAVLAAAAPGAILGNVFSVAADYVSRRVLAAGGAFGFAASLLLFGAAHSFAALAIASFVMGLAATAMVDAGEVALADLAGDDLAPTLAVGNLLGSLGDLAGPVILIVATAFGFGWRGPFALVAILMAAYGIWLASSPLPPPSRTHDREPPTRALRAVLRDRRVWFFAAVAMLLGPLDEALLAFLIAFAEQARGLSPTAAVAIGMCTIAGSVIGFLARSLHRGASPTMTRPACVMAVSAVGVAALPWTLALASCAFTFGIAMAMFWTTVHAGILQLRPGQAGSVNAVVSTVEFSGFVLPILFGVVADRAGVHAGMICYALTAIALATLVGTAGSILRERDELRQH